MRKSTKLKIFRRKKRSVILSVLKRHSLRQHTTGRVGNTGYRAGEERGIWTREDYGTAAVRELTIIFIHADRKKVLHDFFSGF